MTDTKYTQLSEDKTIFYTDAELADKKYSIQDAINTAEIINKDRGRGSLRFTHRHNERFSLLSNRSLNLAHLNAVITDVLFHEQEYVRRSPVAVAQPH